MTDWASDSEIPRSTTSVSAAPTRDAFTLLAIVTGSLSVLRHRCREMDDETKDEVFHLGTEAAAELALKLRTGAEKREIKLQD